MTIVRKLRAKMTDTLPADIHAALVESLFQNFISMTAGTVCAASAALMTSWKTGDPYLWPSALIIATVGLWRAFQMRRFGLERPHLTSEQTIAWEGRYGAGALLYAFTLGLWCLFALAGTDDPIAHLLCTTVTIGYTAGGAGRNCGRPWIVVGQIVAACGPMALGLWLHGGFYYQALAILNVLYFIALHRIALSLQQINLRALFSSRDAARLARRFDTALNNMPNGLCMFSAEGRVSVFNSRLADLLGVSSDIVSHAPTVRDLVAASVRSGTMSATEVETTLVHFENGLAGYLNVANITMADDRILELTFQPMDGGGSVVLVEDITERRNAELKIRHMARFDALTGLPNRTHFRDLIDATLVRRSRDSAQCALFFIDLDQFKQVNDTLGHPCGDELLCTVAERLRQIVDKDDIVARFGGDEFVVFRPELADGYDPETLARRIVERLGDRYNIQGHQIVIGASIGIMTSRGRNLQADYLLKNADMALYRAKAEGRGTWRFFSPEMAEALEARRRLELDLRSALATDAFELYYQPLLHLKTNKVITCEALLRWRHPERGLISPAEFIPIVEDMGLIKEVGRWILHTACQECATWPEAVSVAVNLSSLQFRDLSIVTDIRDALAASGLAPQRLEIEITETSLLHNTALTHEALDEIGKDGIRISLDDFGTGYSSLSYLHRFPLQKVKIDRSFLEGLTRDRPITLLRGIARLSAELGLSVVVEGIETEEQLALISSEPTISEVQGFLFSRPMPRSQIGEFLSATYRPTFAQLATEVA